MIVFSGDIRDINVNREQRRQQNGGATYGAADEEEEEEDELVDGEQAMDIETGADDEHDGAATSGSLTQQVYAKPETPAATAGAAPMPEIVLGTSESHGLPVPVHGMIMAHSPVADPVAVKDDATKNLVMSWYYAGYYTGLQESLQKAAATTDAGKKGS